MAVKNYQKVGPRCPVKGRVGASLAVLVVASGAFFFFQDQIGAAELMAAQAVPQKNNPHENVTKRIIANCRQYAEEDKIAASDFEEYMQQCVRDMRDAPGEESGGGGLIGISDQSLPSQSVKESPADDGKGRSAKSR